MFSRLRQTRRACLRSSSKSCNQHTAKASLNTLSFEQFGNKDAPKTAIFMHGMLGSKKNMRTPCREFIKSNPEFSCITVDVRGHGMSHSLGGEHTIEECARDLEKLLENLNIAFPHVLIAHSLAGKIALKYIEQCTQHARPVPHNTWILDSLPGPYHLVDEEDSQTVANIVRTLHRLPMPQESRQKAVQGVTELGIPLPIAQWLGTSLRPTTSGPPGQVTWMFDLATAKELFSDIVQLDMRPFLEEYTGDGMIHFVRAGRSEKWTNEVSEYFNKLTAKDGLERNLRLHLMPNVGHWLHSEDLPGLLKIINANYN